MKPLHFDAINPFTGQPFKWGDPNLKFVNGKGVYLEPSDDGFVPYPGQILPKPKPKKKPFRRTPRQKTEPQPAPYHTMNTFQFNVIPNSQGGYRAAAVLGERFTEAAILPAIATAGGVTEEQATNVIKAFLAQLRQCSAGCGWGLSLFGELSIRPTAGGSQPGPNDFDNAEEINADIALTFTTEVIAAWRSGLTLENMGTKGLVTPVIDTVVCLADDAENHYVVGDNIRLVGHDLRFDKADLTQGVFFLKADNSEVRGTIYGVNNPKEVVVLVPAGLTGDLRLRIAAYINGSVRSYTYTGILS